MILFGCMILTLGLVWVGGQLYAAAHGVDPFLKDWVLSHAVLLVGAIIVAKGVL